MTRARSLVTDTVYVAGAVGRLFKALAGLAADVVAARRA